MKEEPEDYYEMLKEEPGLNIERTKSCINVKIENNGGNNDNFNIPGQKLSTNRNNIEDLS